MLSAKLKLKNIYPVREYIATGRRSMSAGYNALRKFSNGVFWTVFAFLLFSPVNIVFAQDAGGSPPKRSSSNELVNPLQFDTIKGFLEAMLNAVVTIATPIVVLMLVYSGFLFVKAQGNTDKLTEAKKAITWTIIGAVIVLGAFVLSSAIKGTVDQLQNGSTNSTLDAYNRTLFDESRRTKSDLNRLRNVRTKVPKDASQSEPLYNLNDSSEQPEPNTPENQEIQRLRDLF
ncbi:MAG: pilin [Candidatus Paceibacteria bacterium]